MSNKLDRNSEKTDNKWAQVEFTTSKDITSLQFPADTPDWMPQVSEDVLQK